jgi:hypothetical protein
LTSPPNLFLNGSSRSDSVTRVHKFFIQGYDGIPIEGLEVKNQGKVSSTVVLALVAKFQPEHHFFNAVIKDIHQLFNTKVVFISHRNFSVRSDRRATSLDQIVRDVLSFANHYHDKQLVLYGMCGGSAPMLLAANHLLNNNRSCKVIIDRFAQRYKDFVDPKTSIRYAHLNYSTLVIPSMRNYSKLVLELSFSFFLYLIMKLCFYIVGYHINFATLAKRIPEGDLLVLQIRSPKIREQRFPTFTDAIIHPENELRAAFKDIRSQRKALFLKLIDYCRQLGVQEFFQIELQPVFQQLEVVFTQCIQLINNEKLTGKTTPYSSLSKVNECHVTPLTELTTRNGQNIGNFITGFFNKPGQSSLQYLNLLTTCPTEEIEALLDNSTIEHNKQEFASNFALLLTTLKHNAVTISKFTDRLLSMSDASIIEPLKTLFDSSIYQQIEQRERQDDTPGL